MTIGLQLPGVSPDFPKLIKTLASFGEKEFDYWDDLEWGIYENSNNKELNLKSYFKKISWVNLNKQYPLCPELEYDWGYIDERYVKNVEGTKYRVNQEKLANGPLSEYMKESIPTLTKI